MRKSRGVSGYTPIYSARIFSLIVTTVLGVLLATWCAVLVRLLYEMPGIIMHEDVIATVAVGVGFVCFGTLYVFLVRKTPRNRPSSLKRHQPDR
jgi:hypothetical protein